MPTKTVHQNRWKTIQRSSKTQKKVKLGLLILGLIVLVMIIGKTISFVQSLLQPITKGEIAKHYIWDGSSNINLVVRGDSIAILSFNPVNNEVMIINVPQNTYVDVPEGRGQWMVSSIFNLGESDNPPTGNQLLKRSLSAFLGIPVDGYLEFKGSLRQKDADQIVKGFKKGPEEILSALSQIKTNLAPVEFVRLSLGLVSIRFDKFKGVNMEDILKRKWLPDGTIVLTGDLENIDNLSQKFVESRISDERLSVAIFNATKYPGLGQKAARLITNMGGNVITVSNASHEVKNSQIWGKKNTYTYKRLREVFVLDCLDNPKCDTILGTDKSVEESRADINLILGEDFYHK